MKNLRYAGSLWEHHFRDEKEDHVVSLYIDPITNRMSVEDHRTGKVEEFMNFLELKSKYPEIALAALEESFRVMNVGHTAHIQNQRVMNKIIPPDQGYW
jgi:hypothetical protein